MCKLCTPLAQRLAWLPPLAGRCCLLGADYARAQVAPQVSTRERASAPTSSASSLPGTSWRTGARWWVFAALTPSAVRSTLACQRSY